MSKKVIGFSIVGIVVVFCLAFFGVRMYLDRAQESKEQMNDSLSQQLNTLYIDQEMGYFNEETKVTDFNHLLSLAKTEKANQATVATIKNAKSDFQLQEKTNDLFESTVLDGLNLSARPILAKVDEGRKIAKLESSLSSSSAVDKDWGNDLATILTIAETQSKNYSSAQTLVQNLIAETDVALDDYLNAVEACALLPDGKFKDKLINKLTPIRTTLLAENKSFATKVTSSETRIQAAAKKYQEEQAAQLTARNQQLALLQASISEKQILYNSYKAALDSIKNSQDSSEEESDSDNSDSNSDDESSSTSSTSSSSSSSSESSVPSSEEANE